MRVSTSWTKPRGGGLRGNRPYFRARAVWRAAGRAEFALPGD